MLSLLLLFNAAFAVRIGVVGSGVGGASFSLWIKRQIPDAEITIFEKSNDVGGRVLNFAFDGQTIEIGANLIILENLYFRKLSEELGLEKNMFKERPSAGPGAFWNGKEFTFSESDWFVMNIFNGLKYFGYSPPTIVKSYVNEFLDRFTKLYDLLDSNHSFSTPESLLNSVNLLEPTTRNFRDELRLMLDLEESEPFPSFVDDVVGGVLKCNYASNFDVNGLVGLVSTAPIAVGSASAWNVKGGNRQLVDKALEESKASVKFQSQVDEITSRENSALLTLTSGESFEFDYIAIATPSPLAEIKMNRNPLEGDFEMIYLYVTFVHGRLNGAHFGIDQTYAERLNSILVPESVDLEFNSIGKQGIDSNNPSYALYKVFSMAKLSDAFYEKVFLDIKETFRNEIFAYPKYEGAIENWMPFELSERVFYINALETAISAMEVSIMGAKNVANLIATRHQTEHVERSKIERTVEEETERAKTEL